ncbi:MAG TPA: phosphatidylglycerophosphatase A [Balneolales bacterium]|nr:phosphatidylglycerophosphatase A [Balneolales bacterium]
MDAIKRFIGTGLYSGLIPGMPGTWGSLIALIFIIPVALYTSLAGIIIFVIITSLLTLWSADSCEKKWGADPGRMVMDEWAGQALTFIFVLPSFHSQYLWVIAVSGFVLFRIFDITKILGVNRLQTLKGGIGILADDLLAAVYAGLCLNFLTFIIIR